MTEWNTEELVGADKRFVWHPFIDMRAWCAAQHEPLVLVEGRGALLLDSRGREYIDGNSSIWTNIHGHNHPHINAAIHRQLGRVAHISFLGFTNPAAIELAQAIVALFPRPRQQRLQRSSSSRLFRAPPECVFGHRAHYEPFETGVIGRKRSWSSMK